jgi:hypothetical protein
VDEAARFQVDRDVIARAVELSCGPGVPIHGLVTRKLASAKSAKYRARDE